MRISNIGDMKIMRRIGKEISGRFSDVKMLVLFSFVRLILKEN